MNRRHFIIYISGSYRGNTEVNILKARKQAIELWELGFTILTPHLNTQHFELDCHIPENEYIKGDIEILKRCNGLFMLDNWQDSEGARKEYQVAQQEGLPIFHNLMELTNWIQEKERNVG